MVGIHFALLIEYNFIKKFILILVKRKCTKYISRICRRNLGLSIDDRNIVIDEIIQFGYWEIDTIHGKKKKMTY